MDETLATRVVMETNPQVRNALDQINEFGDTVSMIDGLNGSAAKIEVAHPPNRIFN